MDFNNIGVTSTGHFYPFFIYVFVMNYLLTQNEITKLKLLTYSYVFANSYAFFM